MYRCCKTKNINEKVIKGRAMKGRAMKGRAMKGRAKGRTLANSMIETKMEVRISNRKSGMVAVT